MVGKYGWQNISRNTETDTMARPFTKRMLSSSPPPSDQTTASETLISAAVSILTHHRSKTRWSYLRSLLSPNGITPSEFSQITLHLKNNPHLALNFFTWSQQKSLCNHNLLSYATTIHVLARSRLKTQAQTLIRIAIRVSESNVSHPLSGSPPKLFETLVRTYRECGSAPFVFDLLIESCLESKRIDGSIAIVRMLQSRGISPKIGTCNSLISTVSRCRGVEAGYAIYWEIFGLDGEDVVKKNRIRITPNVQTFNTLMVCYYQEGMMEKVEELLGEMENLNCVPNGYSYSILMAACCDEGKIGEAEKVWEEMGVKRIDPDVVAYNTMIGGFCRIGEIGRAEEFFKEMELAGIESGCVTYEHLINGYCKIEDVDSAMLLYKDMCRKGFKAETSTLEMLIRGLCDKGRIGEALECLKVRAMGDVGFSPGGKSYEDLIKGLCNEGNMEAALRLQADMVGKGFKPNSDIYNAFIDGHVKVGNEEVAERLRKEMFETQVHGKDDMM